MRYETFILYRVIQQEIELCFRMLCDRSCETLTGGCLFSLPGPV